jgi:hypothetical protein
MQKGVDGAHALFDALGQLRPFAGRDDARHDVEGDQAFVCLGLTIDVEGDAGAAEESLGIGRFLAQVLEVFVREPAVIGGVWIACGLAAAEHLIEER